VMHPTSPQLAASRLDAVPDIGQQDARAPAADFLRPPGCVLVLVDVQNDFCHPDGACARMGQDIAPVQRILPAVTGLISLARDFEVPTVFLRVTHGPWFNTDAWLRRGAGGHTLSAETPIVADGTWGAEFCQIRPSPDDLVVTKHRYSGFDHTELELALHAKRCRTVVLAGTQTNVCVRETAFDAVAHGFDVVVVRDCVASTAEGLHDASLTDIAERAGHLVALADLSRAWHEARLPAGRRG
jgi:ureidoacrylate peracid hydrolase